jgi:hypothetical protein
LRMYRALGASPDRPHREITVVGGVRGGVRLHYSDLMSLLPGNPYLRSVEPATLEARSAKQDHWVYLRCEEAGSGITFLTIFPLGKRAGGHPLAGRSSRHSRSRGKNFLLPLISLLAQAVIFR